MGEVRRYGRGDIGEEIWARRGYKVGVEWERVRTSG